jgi:hypothetical protein
VLNASTYTVRELSLAGMSRGFWAWYIPDFFQSYYFQLLVFNPDLS